MATVDVRVHHWKPLKEPMVCMVRNYQYSMIAAQLYQKEMGLKSHRFSLFYLPAAKAAGNETGF